ncbi:MAG: class I SAM-dependent methyltransferase [Candidatus Paceibacterota bacterium]
MDGKNKNAVEIYDLIAEDYAKKFDPIESDEDLRFLNFFLSHLKPKSTILDIGCGTGFSAGYFNENGMAVEGVDLSKNMIAIAKRNYPNIKFTIGDLREFSPQKPVNAVWAGYSLFHFEQTSLEKTLERIKTYLLPNGIFGLAMQEGVGEIELNEPFLPKKKIYIHLYTKEELVKILEKHGFEVINQDLKKTAEYEFPYNKILIIARLK